MVEKLGNITKGKIKKPRRGSYMHITIVIIVMTVSMLLAYIAPFFQSITYIYYGDEYESDYDRTYYYDLMEYTDRLYVHKDGDNTTGETWETAYITINDAYSMASSDLDDKIIIFVGFGIFDVNITGQLDIIKNIHIVGSGRDGTIFSNSHVLADYVFNVSRYFKIEYCGIFYNQSCGGIYVYGDNSDVHLKYMKFYTEAGYAESPISLQLEFCEYGEFENIYFYGMNTTSMAINISEGLCNHFENIEICGYGTGISIIGADSKNNIFKNIRILETALGLYINNGSGQCFYNVEFFGCIVDVNDTVGNSYWN